MQPLQERFRRRGVREQLEPLLHTIDTSWGQYTRHKEEVTAELVAAKQLVIPLIKGAFQWPYEWQAHRVADALHRLDANKQVLLIPAKTKLFRKSPAKSTLKKGRLLNVHYEQKENLDLRANFIKQVQKVTQDEFFYGWNFAGVHHSTHEYRTVLLYDHIRAQIAQKELQQTAPAFTPLCDYEPSRGILIVKNMSSFETGKTYDDFVIEGVVLKDQVSKYPERTYDFSSTHNCYKTTYAKTKFGRDYEVVKGKLLTSARQGRETAIDHHVILAMHVAEKTLAQEGLPIYNPFISANKESLTLFDKLHNNVLIDSYQGDGLRRMPLEIAHIENLLWNNVAYNNAASKKRKTI